MNIIHLPGASFTIHDTKSISIEPRMTAFSTLRKHRRQICHGKLNDTLLQSDNPVMCDKPDPSRHGTLNQCWFNAGPASQTVGPH